VIERLPDDEENHRTIQCELRNPLATVQHFYPAGRPAPVTPTGGTPLRGRGAKGAGLRREGLM